MNFNFEDPIYDSNLDPEYRKYELEKGSVQFFYGYSKDDIAPCGVYAFFLSFKDRKYVPISKTNADLATYFGLNKDHPIDGFGLFFTTDDILTFTQPASSLYELFLKNKPLILLGQMGALLWIYDLETDINKDLSVYPSMWLTSPFMNNNWYLREDIGHFITPQAENAKIRIHTNHNSLTMTAQGDILLFNGAPLPSLGIHESDKDLHILLDLCGVQIHAGGPKASQITVSGMTADLSPLPLCIPFTTVISGAVGTRGELSDTQFTFPFLNPGETLAGTSMQAIISPLIPGGNNINNDRLLSFSFNNTINAFASAYRTIFGEPVYLQPVNTTDLHFISCYGLDGQIHLTLNGTYTLSVPNAPVAESVYQLVCGLSGLETVSFCEEDQIIFYGNWSWAAAMNAAITPTGQPSYQNKPNIDLIYKSSPVSFVKGPNNRAGLLYSSQSPQSPQFTVQTGITQLPVQNTGGMYINTMPSPDTAVLLMPYGNIQLTKTGLGSNAADFMALETGYFAPMRNQIIVNTCTGTSAALDNVTTVTPQGFIITYDESGAPSEIQIATSNTPDNPVNISFSGNTTILSDLLDSLNTSQPFIVMTCLPKGSQGNSPQVIIDGWSFNPVLPPTLIGNQYETVLIIKAGTSALSQLVAAPEHWGNYQTFNDTQFDDSGNLLSSYLTGYIQNARQMYNSGITALAEFIDIIDNPDWSGMLLIQPPLIPPGEQYGSSDNLIPLFLGTEDNTIYGHHLAVESNFVDTTAAAPTQESGIFGLVHYLRPGTPPARIGTGQPAFVPSSVPYDYQLLYLHAQFQHSQMTNFTSQSQLIIGQFMGSQVVQGPPTSTVIGGNSLPIQGSAQQLAVGGFNYTFTMPAGFATTMFLNGPAISQITINQLSTQTQNNIVDSLTLCFMMSGALGTQSGSSIDLLSYSSLAFDNFVINLTYDWTALPPLLGFNEDISGLLLLTLKEQAATSAQPDSTVMPLNNLYRSTSLAGQMPVGLSSFLWPGNTLQPEDMGYVPISIKGGPSGKLNQWYGLVYSLNMGNTGASGSGVLVSAQLLFAWDPTSQAADPPPVQAYLLLQGPNGIPMQLVVEDVIKLGPKSLQLIIDTSGPQPRYLLELQSIGLTVLSQTFPNGGMANLYLAGFTDASSQRSLAWFGGYSKNKN
jgi:hypothetical protein